MQRVSFRRVSGFGLEIGPLRQCMYALSTNLLDLLASGYLLYRLFYKLLDGYGIFCLCSRGVVPSTLWSRIFLKDHRNPCWLRRAISPRSNNLPAIAAQHLSYFPCPLCHRCIARASSSALLKTLINGTNSRPGSWRFTRPNPHRPSAYCFIFVQQRRDKRGDGHHHSSSWAGTTLRRGLSSFLCRRSGQSATW